jgi:hypothetical protein
MEDIIDPTNLAYTGNTKPANGPSAARVRKAGQQFLKGPVPLPWLAAAARLPGRTLHVGIALWYLAGLRKTQTVTLSNKTLSQFGVDRHAKRRALEQLEAADLVKVDRQENRNPRVTILPDGGAE